MSDELLKVDSIRVCYGESQVIERLSLSAAKNEILTVLGLNGMGKTTLMKALIGLLPIRSGAIELDGKDIAKIAPFERVGVGLAYVPQGRMVFPTLTVEENIVSGLRKSDRHVPADLYKLFPVLKEMKRRRAGNLSGGQQQQLAIARALASKPRVLLLDEPTEGIQPSIIKDLAQILKRIRDEQGVTIVVSEQVLSFALAVADRVIVLSRGRVIHEGSGTGLDEASLGKLLSL